MKADRCRGGSQCPPRQALAAASATRVASPTAACGRNQRGELGLGTLANRANSVGFVCLFRRPQGHRLPPKSKAYWIDPPSRPAAAAEAALAEAAGDVAASAESARGAARSHKVCPARVLLGPRCAQDARILRWETLPDEEGRHGPSPAMAGYCPRRRGPAPAFPHPLASAWRGR